MSCVASSPLLSDRTRFPRYFQLLSSARRIALGYYGVIKQYAWRRVALIVQDSGVFTVVSCKLKSYLCVSYVCVHACVYGAKLG